MKKLLLLLTLALTTVFLSGCYVATEDEYDAQYLMYADLDVYDAPTATAEIIGKLKITMKPITIKEFADHGRFGLLDGQKAQDGGNCWIRVDDPNHVVPYRVLKDSKKYDVYVVQPYKIPISYRPSEIGIPPKNPVLLHHGDTVRATARHDGWIHVESVKYTKKSRVTECGWIPDNDETIAKLGSMTFDEYDLNAKALAFPEEVAKVRAKQREKSGEAWMDYRPMEVLHWITYILMWVLGAFAIIYAAILVFGDVEASGYSAWWLLASIGVLLIVCAFFARYPHWMMAPVTALLTFVLFFPTTRWSFGGWYPTLFLFGSLGWMIVYLIVLFIAHTDYSGFDWWLALGGYVLMGLVVTGVIGVAHTYLESRVCPYCGFFGEHPEEDSRTETSVSTSHGHVDEYSHSETHGSTKVNYYVRRPTLTVTTTRTTTHYMRCLHCGNQFTYVTSTSNSETHKG